MSENPAMPPLSRKLSRPYYLLRTPDGRGHYFTRDVQRALFSANEPLTRFLAKATLDDPERPAVLHYTFPVDVGALSPMKYVPPAELEALQKAIGTFLERAQPGTGGVTAFEKELRAGFRLPDPNQEPDAYWVYGPPHDQKILILWGCEFQANTSLPIQLGPREEGQTIGQALASKEMPLEARAEVALNLATHPEELLAGHLLRPRLDSAGRVVGYSLGERSFGKGEFKAAKFFPAGQVQEFEDAARAYYAKAKNEGTASARRYLRLPDPKKHANRYGTLKTPDGERLVAVVEPPVPETLAVTDDASLNLPPASSDGELEPTVTQRLWQKKAPWKPVLAAAAAMLILLLVVGVFFGLLADREPPVLLDVIAENDPTRVQLRFSEPISEASLFAAEGNAADDRRLVLRDFAGKRLPILDREVDEDDPAIVHLEVEPLQEDRYILRLEPGVADASPRGNALTEAVERSFDYRDRLPPELVQISAHGEIGRRLILIFNEPLDPSAADRLNFYTIEGAEIVAVEQAESPNRLTLEAADPFIDGESYVLTLYGVPDASLLRNARREPVTIDFAYEDILPPRLERVEARRVQNEVDVVFSERLAEAGAQDPTRYRIEDLDTGAQVAIAQANLLEDGRTVVLTTDVLENGKRYGLFLRGVPDRSPQANALSLEEPAEFYYTGRPDLEGPDIAQVRALPNGRRILLRYDEGVDRERALNAGAYTLDPLIPILAVEPGSAGNRDYSLQLGEEMDDNVAYTLTVTDLEDRLGNVSATVTYPDIRRPGVRTIGSVDVLGFRSVAANDNGSAIEIEFTAPVLPEDLSDVEKYEISGGIAVRAVELDPARPTWVRLNLLRPLQSQQYEVVAREMRLASDPEQEQDRVVGRVNGPGYMGW